MLESFSKGYYRAKMEVQPFDDGPAIERGLYQLIDRRIYDTTTAPITMRLGLDAGPRFTPSTENAMPKDVIGVPESVLDEADIHPSDDNVNVFVLKPKAAYRFNQTMNPSAEYCYDNDGNCKNDDTSSHASWER
jgi:hypothetical protein